jgi:gluconolactonase
MKTMVTPVLVGTGLRFSEGVNFDRDGTLYCVDYFGGSVCRMPPGGELRPWVHTGGQPNGSRFGPDGDLFVADAGRKVILRLTTATGAETVYADQCEEEPFRGPNDLCFGPDGTLYFTDPDGSSLGNPIGAVYAVAPNGAVSRIVTGLAFPNGVMVTPDGATLIVGDTFTGKLHRHGLDQARRYQELAPLATLHPHGEGENEAGPDGFAFGADGNLYAAHYGSGFVQVVSPNGELVASLPAGGRGPTNVAFWQDSLYVTEGDSGSIYRLDVGVREQPTFMRPW